MSLIPYILTKVTGFAAAGYVLKNANYAGKVNADLYATEKDIQETAKYFNNTLYLNNMDVMEYKIKQRSFEDELDQSYKRSIFSAIGYLKGLGSSIMSDIALFGLGMGAILFKARASHPVSKVFAGICAIGAAAIMAKRAFEAYFAIGVPNSFRKDDVL